MAYGYIYRLKSKLNHKCYIGQTTNVNPYKYINSSYKIALGKQRPKLSRHIKKYGFDDLRVDIIDISEYRQNLDDLEVYYIKFFDCLKNGLNCKDGGSNGKHSHETRVKMSLKALGRDTSSAVKASVLSRTGKPAHNRKFIQIQNRITNEIHEGFMNDLCSIFKINKKNLSYRNNTKEWRII